MYTSKENKNLGSTSYESRTTSTCTTSPDYSRHHLNLASEP